MPNEPADGFLLLALLDVYAQHMGGPGFMFRDDQMRDFWNEYKEGRITLATFLTRFQSRIKAIAGHNHTEDAPVIDFANAHITWRIGINLLRVYVAANMLVNLEGPLDELPPFIRVNVA